MSEQKFHTRKRHTKNISKLSLNSKKEPSSYVKDSVFEASITNTTPLPKDIHFSITTDSMSRTAAAATVHTPDSNILLNSSSRSQLQKYLNVDTDTVPIDALRKKAQIRNKYKMIRNANRLTPVMNINGKRLSSESKQSNMNELEGELDILLK